MDEIFLGFRYQGGVNTTIIGVYKNEKVYLPVQELFRELFINVNYDPATTDVSGFYIQMSRRYQLNFRSYTARVGNEVFPLTIDDYHVGELDVYLEVSQFNRLFGLEFTVDYTNMILRLVANEKLPILIRYERERRRLRNESRVRREASYDIRLPRNRQWLSGYFMDYAVSQRFVNLDPNSSRINLQFGNETLFGDVQGGYSFQHTRDGTFTEFQSFRYRYVFEDNPVVSQFYAGQLQSQASAVNTYTGVRLTNQPLYQPRVFEEFQVVEQTIPEATVEVFINDRLLDVLTADELGQVRISVPISYGQNDIKLVVIGNNGEIIESTRRIEVPFNFIPKNAFRYDVGGGRTPITNALNPRENDYLYGVLRFAPLSNVTTSVSSELLRDETDTDLIVSSSTSIRLLRSLLLNTDISPGYSYQVDAYYQAMKGLYVRTYFSDFNTNSVLNRLQLDRNMGGSFYMPFSVFEVPMTGRVTFDRSEFTTFETRRYTLDLNTRIKRAVVRGGYRETLRYLPSSRDPQSTRRYLVSSSYSIPPFQRYWLPLRGVFLRGQVDFTNNLNTMEQIDLGLSRSISKNGRMQFNWVHNARAGTNVYFLSFSYDFNAFRSTTSYRRNRTGESLTNQTFRGSVTYDRPNQMFWIDNRAQVGRSAVSAVLFVDADGDGRYGEGDELIPDNALRVLGAGSRVKSRNGVTTITQLQPYYRYDVELNTGDIKNPSLVPTIDKFSIVTDPNQHKQIMIPFERTGVIDGKVERERIGVMEGIGGLRLDLKEESGRYEAVIRTFSDGSFYQFEVPPGNYTLTVDTLQLRILQSRSVPDTLRFSVRSLPDGDFIDGLYVKLQFIDGPPEPPRAIPAPEPARPEVVQYFRIQTAMMSTLARAIMAKIEIEEATGIPHEIQYSRRWDNYRVFSTEIAGLDKTLAGMAALRKTPFNDAFIINEQTFNTEDLFYAVQVGAFPDSARAARHVADIKQLYDLDGQIQFDAIARHYKVLLAPMSDFAAVSAMRERIRTTTSITDAFVITQPNVNYRDLEFTVQLARFDTQADAFRLSQRLTTRHRTQNYVVQSGGYYFVRTRPTNRLEDAVSEYKRLKSEGFDAIIVTIRS